jgi:hypothetical protein
MEAREKAKVDLAPSQGAIQGFCEGVSEFLDAIRDMLDGVFLGIIDDYCTILISKNNFIFLSNIILSKTCLIWRLYGPFGQTRPTFSSPIKQTLTPDRPLPLSIQQNKPLPLLPIPPHAATLPIVSLTQTLDHLTPLPCY